MFTQAKPFVRMALTRPQATLVTLFGQAYPAVAKLQGQKQVSGSFFAAQGRRL